MILCLCHQDDYPADTNERVYDVAEGFCRDLVEDPGTDECADDNSDQAKDKTDTDLGSKEAVPGAEQGHDCIADAEIG